MLGSPRMLMQAASRDDSIRDRNAHPLRPRCCRRGDGIMSAALCCRHDNEAGNTSNSTLASFEMAEVRSPRTSLASSAMGLVGSFVFEGQFQLHSVEFHLAVLDADVLLDDLCDAQV